MKRLPVPLCNGVNKLRKPQCPLVVSDVVLFALNANRVLEQESVSGELADEPAGARDQRLVFGFRGMQCHLCA